MSKLARSAWTLPARTLGVGVTDSVYILHDRRAGFCERSATRKRVGIGR
jgi:hypothetical protein